MSADTALQNEARGFSDHVHLGNFSLDENRNYCDDLRNRKFFVDPGIWPKFDLLAGHAEFVDRDRGGDDVEVKSLDALLRWMRDHQEILKRQKITEIQIDGSKRLVMDFVTRRGALHDLFKSAHLNDRSEFLVTFFRGTYYLEQIELPGRHDNPNDPDGKQVYSGKKFAQYCTSENGQKPDTSQPINDNLAYEAVMLARCGNHRFMFDVEVHAEFGTDIEGKMPSEVNLERVAKVKEMPSQDRGPHHHLNYVNIRTTRDFNAVTDIPQSKSFFRKKLFQFWSQNHIAGIPRIFLGWRDDARHVINRVETYMTEDIPTFPMCPWKPAKYYNAIQALLTEITQRVTHDDASVVYRLGLEKVESAPFAEMAGKLCHRSFKIERLTDGQHRILSDWFLRDVLNIK